MKSGGKSTSAEGTAAASEESKGEAACDEAVQDHRQGKGLVFYSGPEGFCFFFLNLLIYLFLAALGLCCCTQAFSSCGEQGLLFVAVHGLLIAVASFVAEHGL